MLNTDASRATVAAAVKAILVDGAPEVMVTGLHLSELQQEMVVL